MRSRTRLQTVADEVANEVGREVRPKPALFDPIGECRHQQRCVPTAEARNLRVVVVVERSGFTDDEAAELRVFGHGLELSPDEESDLLIWGGNLGQPFDCRPDQRLVEGMDDLVKEVAFRRKVPVEGTFDYSDFTRYGGD